MWCDPHVKYRSPDQQVRMKRTVKDICMCARRTCTRMATSIMLVWYWGEAPANLRVAPNISPCDQLGVKNMPPPWRPQMTSQVQCDAWRQCAVYGPPDPSGPPAWWGEEGGGRGVSAHRSSPTTDSKSGHMRQPHVKGWRTAAHAGGKIL